MLVLWFCQSNMLNAEAQVLYGVCIADMSLDRCSNLTPAVFIPGGEPDVVASHRLQLQCRFSTQLYSH